MNEKIDVTDRLVITDSLYEDKSSSVRTETQRKLTIFSDDDFLLRSLSIFRVKSRAWVYKTGVDQSELNHKRALSHFYIEAIFEDGSRKTCGVGSFLCSGVGSWVAWTGANEEDQEVKIKIPKEYKDKKIKEFQFLYMSHYNEYMNRSNKETRVEILGYYVYVINKGLAGGFRIAGENGKIYKILETTEESPLRFFYKRVKYIMLVPLDDERASPFRIKTRDGIKAIAAV